MITIENEFYNEIIGAMQYLMLEIGDKYSMLSGEGFYELCCMKLFDNWDYKKAGNIFIKFRDMETDNDK